MPAFSDQLVERSRSAIIKNLTALNIYKRSAPDALNDARASDFAVNIFCKNSELRL